jgi:hypothetical protein
MRELREQNFDRRGWAATNPLWHEVILHEFEPIRYWEIVVWLYDQIDNPEKHVRWGPNAVGDNDWDMRFRFRFEKDVILFKLRWG